MTHPIERMNPKTLPNAGALGYSQISIVEPARLAFVSGQVAWTPDGGAVPGTLSEQTEIVTNNLGHALEALKARPEDIVQMRVYMTDLREETMGVAMGGLLGFLGGARPSLTGIGVSALAAPDLMLEVEMVVRLPE